MQTLADFSHSELIAILESLETGIAIYDRNERLIFANKTAETLHPEHFKAMREGAVLAEGIQTEIRKHYPDASDAEIAEIASPVVNDIRSGKVIDVTTHDEGKVYRSQHTMLDNGLNVGVIIDVSEMQHKAAELKAARKTAQGASQAKSMFLAWLSHEIRTPLNGMIGVALALKRKNLDEESRKLVDTLLDSTHHMMHLLNDSLDISKIESGKLEICPEPTDLRELMRRIEQSHLSVAREKGLTLKLAVSGDTPAFLEFDAFRVRQCLDNLISNALKFTQQGSVLVAVSSAPAEENGRTVVKIHVSDTGLGMTRKQSGKLFEKFQQADTTTSRRFGGTGLGLSICRQLAHLMGGDVSVVSELGKGSVFTLTFEALDPLPRSKPEHDAPESACSASNQSCDAIDGYCRAGRRALLVDDNSLNRRVARLLMEPMCITVTEADSGEAALQKLGEEAFDLVLMDIHMPGMDGMECAARIRDSGQPWSNVPIIAVTADALTVNLEACLAAGMQDCVYKPFSESELIEALERCLGVAVGSYASDASPDASSKYDSIAL